ncbi:MAG: S1 RNA-binding domain-containing protein [Anaerolineae bacterium]|nr:S1 RNA-binding domain-containing protein [Anaerolineae bacterium]
MKADLIDESKDAAETGSMAELLEHYLPTCQVKRGQVVQGTIIRVSPQEIVVDIGAKCEGTVLNREIEKMDPLDVADLQPGSEVTAYVINPDGPGGAIVLSMARAQQEEGWRRAEALLKSKKSIKLEVISANRGGLIVRVGSVRGFVPASQLDPRRRIPRISDTGCHDALSDVVGSQMELQVIEVDRERNRLILSERTVLGQRRAEEAESLLDKLKEGDVCQGRISNLTHFGAFVDLGGLDGLLHLSEISWRPVGHPNDMFQLGQEIEVVVINVDRERQQVALSLKRLESDPWVNIDQRYKVGQTVEGRITRLTKWGAFARIVGDEAIEGLIHISELDEARVAHPRDAVRTGEVHMLRVVRIEADRHRMALSLKQAKAEEQAGTDWKSDYESSQEPPLEGSMAAALNEAMQE